MRFFYACFMMTNIWRPRITLLLVCSLLYPHLLFTQHKNTFYSLGLLPNVLLSTLFWKKKWYPCATSPNPLFYLSLRLALNHGEFCLGQAFLLASCLFLTIFSLNPSIHVLLIPTFFFLLLLLSLFLSVLIFCIQNRSCNRGTLLWHF